MYNSGVIEQATDVSVVRVVRWTVLTNIYMRISLFNHFGDKFIHPNFIILKEFHIGPSWYHNP